jgi:hypothetical protein
MKKRALAQYSLINVSAICPAVILAANWNNRVTGRIDTLIVSIIIRNGFNQS